MNSDANNILAQLGIDVPAVRGTVPDAMADTATHTYRKVRNPLTVLFVLSVANTQGGAAKVWLNLLRGLPAYGVKPFVVMPSHGDGSMAAALEELGVPYMETFYTWWVTTDSNPRSLKRRFARRGAKFANARAEAQVAEALEEAQADLVYICDGSVTLGLDAAQQAGIPVVWHFHQFIRGAQDGLWFIDLPEEVAQQLQRAARIVTVNQGQRDDLCQRFGLDQKKVSAVYNGVDLRRAGTKTELLSGEAVTFTLAGRVDANKRHQDAVEAFDLVAGEYPQARLLLVGDGTDAAVDALRQKVAASPYAERIELRGYTDDMPALWAETDVALNCSLSEGCSMVLAEAMASGCLVIASDAEGNAELLDPDNQMPGMCEGVRGLLYERGSARSLAEQMRWVLEHPVAARQIAAFGRADGRAAFSLEGQLERIRDVFDAAIG